MKNKKRWKVFIYDLLFFCSFFAPAKDPFSENRIRLPPKSGDLKKLSPGDRCEVYIL